MKTGAADWGPSSPVPPEISSQKGHRAEFPFGTHWVTLQCTALQSSLGAPAVAWVYAEDRKASWPSLMLSLQPEVGTVHLSALILGFRSAWIIPDLQPDKVYLVISTNIYLCVCVCVLLFWFLFVLLLLFFVFFRLALGNLNIKENIWIPWNLSTNMEFLVLTIILNL